MCYKVVVVLVLLTVHYSSALRCYTCSMAEEDADQSCVDDPESATITNCDKRYCTINRVEYKDPKGKVQSIQRSCANVNQNEVSEDDSFRYYIRSCNSALCNGGSGTTEPSKGSLGDKSTIYCPGTGRSGATEATLTFTVMLFAAMIFLIQ